MSGAILNICYGINLDVSNIYDEDVSQDDLYKALKDADCIDRLYDAYGGYPYKLFIGVQIVSYHESNSINLSRLAAAITEDPEQYKEEFDSLWAELDDEVRELIVKHFGHSPELFNIWSNS